MSDNKVCLGFLCLVASMAQLIVCQDIQMVLLRLGLALFLSLRHRLCRWLQVQVDHSLAKVKIT